jgi:hypothetical protein
MVDQGLPPPIPIGRRKPLLNGGLLSIPTSYPTLTFTGSGGFDSSVSPALASSSAVSDENSLLLQQAGVTPHSGDLPPIFPLREKLSLWERKGGRTARQRVAERVSTVRLGQSPRRSV